MKTFSFKEKKRYLPVELPDGTKITLPGPKKKTMDALSNLEGSAESFNEIYAVVSEVLSTNLEGRSFTVEDVDNLLDVTDIFDFVQAYTAFVQGGTAGKN